MLERSVEMETAVVPRVGAGRVLITALRRIVKLDLGFAMPSKLLSSISVHSTNPY